MEREVAALRRRRRRHDDRPDGQTLQYRAPVSEPPSLLPTGAELPLTYRDWHLRLPGPDGEAYGEDEARSRFEAGDPVTLLVGPPDAPRVVLTSRRRGADVEVAWLDELGRPACTYVWVHAPEDPQWPGHDQGDAPTGAGELMPLVRVELCAYDTDEPAGAGEPPYRVVVLTGRHGRRTSTLTWPEGEVVHEDVVSPDEVPRQPRPAFAEWLGFLAEEPQMLTADDARALIA